MDCPTLLALDRYIPVDLTFRHRQGRQLRHHHWRLKEGSAHTSIPIHQAIHHYQCLGRWEMN